MKIIVSQKDKKLLIKFNYHPKPFLDKEGKRRLVVDNYLIDKSDGFLLALDKFKKKRKMEITSFKKADLKFENTGMLTERVIRTIIAGLCFE